HLVRGTPVDSVGPRILDFIKKALPVPCPVGNKVLGTVLHVDRFGNIITNLRLKDLGSGFMIRVAGQSIRHLYSNFSEAVPGQFFALEGSTGFIELALNQGSAADKLKVKRGTEIEVESDSANN